MKWVEGTSRKEQVFMAQLRSCHFGRDPYYRYRVGAKGSCERFGEKMVKDHWWECLGVDPCKILIPVLFDML